MILTPILTEKSMRLAAEGWYTFAIPESYSKGKVGEVLKKVYDVDTIKVRTLKVRGRGKRNPLTRRSYRTADQKRALVRLKKGQKLTAFEVGKK